MAQSKARFDELKALIQSQAVGSGGGHWYRMRTLARNIVSLLFVTAAFSLPCFADANVDSAKELFARYVDLGSKYDPALADLYSDNADIQNTRFYPNGQTKTMKLPAPSYKKMIAAAMPIARARNDQDSYSKATFSPKGDGVKIQALRHSHLKNYDSWLVLVVRKENGAWKIVQELSQSKP